MGQKSNMIPDKRLSSTVLAGEFLAPDDRPYKALVDYELGGIALQDPSQGLQVQRWKVELLGDDVTLTDEAGNATVAFTKTGISTLSLAFDQNMNPFVAFTENGIARQWWFDTVQSAQVFTTLPTGAVSPVCCLDDKRYMQTGASDILLFYSLSSDLYFSAERDRYTISYLLRSNAAGVPIKVGMNNVNRVQILMQS